MDSILRRNNVKLLGNGERTIVFAHGFGCDQRVWRRVQPDFEQSHRCVLFDYVGSGLSDWSQYDSSRYSSLRGYARDVIEVCEQLNLEGVTFVGHSVSSMIGILAALEAPRLFDKLVLLAPSPRFIDDPPYRGGFQLHDVQRLFDLMDQNFLGWATSFADVAAQDPDVAHELTENFCSLNARIMREFAQVTFFCDCREELGQIVQQCLVVQCSDDDIAPVEVGEYTARQLHNAVYRLLHASGHLPHLTHAAETSALIRDFLKQTHLH